MCKIFLKKKWINIRNYLLLLILGICFISCNRSVTTNDKKSKSSLKIILDTDFGDDGDDLLTLTLLHYFEDQGKCEILAIGQANSNRESPGAIDVINTYYGRPNIPIGIIKTPLHGHADQYATFLLENYPDMYDLDLDNVPDAVDVYRKALANAKDTSVVFVVVGFKKNMSELLRSKPDSISPLNGIELVKQKVKFVSDMGGFYPEPPEPEKHVPFNFGKVNGTAKYYIDNCPVPIIFAGIRTGEIRLAKKVRKLNTPVGRAIDQKLSHDGGWGKAIEDSQAGFDVVSAFVAIKNPKEFFNIKYGCNELDSTGYNIFTYKKDCDHSHIDALDRKLPFDEIEKIIEKMLIIPPKNSTKDK